MRRLASSSVAWRKTCCLPDPRAEQHVGLPDLIGKLRFVLFMRGSFVEQQLTFGEAPGAQAPCAPVPPGEERLVASRAFPLPGRCPAGGERGRPEGAGDERFQTVI